MINFLLQHKHRMEGKLLYIGLANIIKEALQIGLLQDGDMLPTEMQIEVAMGVSRITVRKAMELLEKEGLIRRRQGQGTFITDRRTVNLIKMPSFTDTTLNKMHIPKEKRLSHTHITFPEEACSALNIPLDSKGHFLKRLRLTDDTPTAIEEKWIPFTIYPEDYLIGSSLYHSLAEIGIFPHSFNRKIFASTAKGEIASLMNLAEGSPILYIIQIGYDRQKKALEFGKIYCQQLFV